MGIDCPENGIIIDTAMAEKRLESNKVRYSVAYPTGAERVIFVKRNYLKPCLVSEIA